MKCCNQTATSNGNPFASHPIQDWALSTVPSPNYSAYTINSGKPAKGASSRRNAASDTRLPAVLGPSIGIKLTATDFPLEGYSRRPFVATDTSGVFNQNPGSAGFPSEPTVVPSLRSPLTGAASTASARWAFVVVSNCSAVCADVVGFVTVDCNVTGRSTGRGPVAPSCVLVSTTAGLTERMPALKVSPQPDKAKPVKTTIAELYTFFIAVNYAGTRRTSMPHALICPLVVGHLFP